MKKPVIKKAKYGIKVNDKKTDRKNKRAEKKASNYKPKPLPKSNSISASDLKKIRSTPKVDMKAKTTCGPKGCGPSPYSPEKKYKAGGVLKTVPGNNVGLSNLPTAVRNKMGYKELGGAVGKACVSQGPGKPKKCKAGKKRRNFDAKRTAGNVLKGIGAAAGAVGVGLAAKFVKDNKKKGGVIRKKK